MNWCCPLLAFALLSSGSAQSGNTQSTDATERAKAEAKEAEAHGHYYQKMFLGRSFIPPHADWDTTLVSEPHSSEPQSSKRFEPPSSTWSEPQSSEPEKIIGPSAADLLYKEGCAPISSLGNGQEDRPMNQMGGLEDYSYVDMWSDADFDAYTTGRGNFKVNLTPDHLKLFQWEVCDLRQRCKLSVMAVDQDGAKAQEAMRIEYKRKLMRVMETFKKTAAKDLAQQMQQPAGARLGSLSAQDLTQQIHQPAGQGPGSLLSEDASATPPQHWTVTLLGATMRLLSGAVLFSLCAVLWRSHQAKQSEVGTNLELEGDTESPECDFQPLGSSPEVASAAV